MKLRRLAHLGIDQFVEHQEQAERIDRARIEIVVAIFGIVEVEARQFPRADQPRHDLLDIGVGRMVAEIDEALGLGAQFAAPP